MSSTLERFKKKMNVIVYFPVESLDIIYAENKIKWSRYNLYAISNHNDTPYCGQYTAYGKHLFTGSWYEY